MVQAPAGLFILSVGTQDARGFLEVFQTLESIRTNAILAAHLILLGEVNFSPKYNPLYKCH